MLNRGIVNFQVIGSEGKMHLCPISKNWEHSQQRLRAQNTSSCVPSFDYCVLIVAAWVAGLGTCDRALCQISASPDHLAAECPQEAQYWHAYPASCRHHWAPVPRTQLHRCSHQVARLEITHHWRCSYIQTISLNFDSRGNDLLSDWWSCEDLTGS